MFHDDSKDKKKRKRRIYSFNYFLVHFTDEELQNWKVEYLIRHHLQRGVPMGNNALN